MSHSRRSAVGSPFTIHSATALPTPPAWVNHTACADQKPRTWGDSPSTGKPSVVNENRPLNLRVRPAPSTLGITSRAAVIAFWKWSGVKGISAGPVGAPQCSGMSSASTSSGSCRYDPMPIASPTCRKYMDLSWWRKNGKEISSAAPASPANGVVTA